MTTRQRSTSTSTDPPVPGEVVLGVDTHGEVHVAAVVSLLGKVLGTESFPATAAGYRRLFVWARKLGTVRRAGVEGTGTFGAGLSRYLLAQHVQVYEVNRPDRTARRLLGKSDPLDAQAAARAVLSGRARARAKTGDGPVHSARMFKLAKDSAVKARTQAINQLKAVLVIADLRGEWRRQPPPRRGARDQQLAAGRSRRLPGRVQRSSTVRAGAVTLQGDSWCGRPPAVGRWPLGFPSWAAAPMSAVVGHLASQKLPFR